MDNISLSHSRYNCTYHLVFIPKYRRKVMIGELVISFMSGMMDGVIRHPAFCDTFTVQIENIGMPYICRFYNQGCGILSVSRKRIAQLNRKEGRDRLCLKLRDR